MADDYASPLTPKAAAELAARFLAIHPIAPRLLTTREADQVTTLIETLTASKLAGDAAPHPEELMYGYWLERLLEGCMALSAQIHRREIQLNGAHVQVAQLTERLQLPAPGYEELREQGAVLALLGAAVLSVGGNIREEIIDRAGLRSRLEDLTAAIAELAPK